MRERLRTVVALATFLALGCAPAAHADSPARYGVTEQKNLPVVMSDGTTLRANVYLPADPKSGKAAAGRFPVVLTETAYGKDAAAGAASFTGLLGDPGYFARRGYIGVLVDVRGTGASEGEWAFNEPQEAQDSKAVIDWVARLPHSNGRVGMTGASYLGITQLFAAAAVGRHSPLKAIFPEISSNSIFREAVMPGGLLDSEGVGFYVALTAAMNEANPVITGDPDSVLAPAVDHVAGMLDFHVGTSADVLTDGARSEDGTYWRARGPERVLAQIVRNHIPAYLVGRLDDAFQSGVFRNYVGLQNASQGRTTTRPMGARQRVSGRYQALVGPWFHAVIGEGGPDLEAIQLRWFDRWLKGVHNGIERTRTPLHVIERSRAKHELARWPLPQAPARAFALTPGGGLSAGPAPAGSATLAWSGLSLPCQRTTETWILGLGEAVADSLHITEPCKDSALQPPLPAPAMQTFTSAPFSAATTLAGPMTAEITMTSTTRDAELIAKVYDVAPDGHASEISTGELLGSQRAIDPALSWRAGNGLLIYAHHPITHAARQPLVPGSPATLDIAIPPTVQTFAPGHRLRLVLATGEFPARLPLPGDVPNLVGGVYGITLGGKTPSRLIVPVLRHP